MAMTPQRWHATSTYLRGVFGAQDQHLKALMENATAAGLPDIAVSADVGRLMQLLTRTTRGGSGADLALEIGTLAGYSGIWIARGLSTQGRLITVEPEPTHAAFARRAFDEAGVGDRVEIRMTTGLEALPALLNEFGPESFDVVFIDAIKTEYPEYLEGAAPLIRTGGLLIADNALGTDSWWIDDAPGASASRDAVDRFNRTLASDERFIASCVPIREGIVIALRV